MEGEQVWDGGYDGVYDFLGRGVTDANRRTLELQFCGYGARVEFAEGREDEVEYYHRVSLILPFFVAELKSMLG